MWELTNQYGNWQINVDSANCFPTILPKQKKNILLILAEGLKLNKKKSTFTEHIKLCSANLSSRSENSVLAEQAFQQKNACTHAPERIAGVNSKSCAWDSERAEPMLKGDRASFTDSFSIIKVMVSILSFLLIKSCFTYIIICRISVNSRL